MTQGQPGANGAQQEYWNSAVGLKWAAHQEKLDLLLTEVKGELVRRAAPQIGETVLDIGCGAGDTTLAFAQSVGPAGAVTGADLSEPLLAVARRRAAGMQGIGFIAADAQTRNFGPGRFDLVASRFGVMFFADTGAAFANLARMLRPGGRLVFAAWDAVARNPWMAMSKEAAVARLGPVGADTPGAPGPFAFADAERVLGLLSGSGLAEVRVATPDLQLVVNGTPEDAAALAASIGPVPRIVSDLGGTDADLAAIKSAIAEAFRPFASGGNVRIPARVHFFSALRP